MRNYYWGILALMLLLGGCIKLDLPLTICENGECLLEAAQVCKPTVYKQPINVSIEGFEVTGYTVIALNVSGDGCVIDIERVDLEAHYSPEARQELLNQNYTPDMIAQMEEEFTKNLDKLPQFQPLKCDFKDPESLYKYLEAMLNGNYNISLDLTSNYTAIKINGEVLGRCWKKD